MTPKIMDLIASAERDLREATTGDEMVRVLVFSIMDAADEICLAEEALGSPEGFREMASRFRDLALVVGGVFLEVNHEYCDIFVADGGGGIHGTWHRRGG